MSALKLCFICGEPSRLVAVEGRDACGDCCAACEAAGHTLEQCLAGEDEPEEWIDVTESLGLRSPWS